MTEVPKNVRQVLEQLLPANVINHIQCYVFYDNHPKDDKNIDITVYTKSGEVREYFQRDIMSSVSLEDMILHNEMRIIRNNMCELFYLLAGSGEITILSCKDKLQVHHKLTEVSRYEISDPACTGKATFKVFYTYSETPQVAEDNFKNFKPIEFPPADRSVTHRPIHTNMMSKLVEAKYSVKCSEATIDELAKARRNLALNFYQVCNPNWHDTIFTDGFEGNANALDFLSPKPWIKCSNGKVVIVHNLCNENQEPLEDVQVLIHGTPSESIEYTPKTYDKMKAPPFWEEGRFQMLEPGVESALVVVISLDEFKDNIVNRIDFNGVILYKKGDKNGILPIKSITISTMETMGEEFDVLYGNDLSDPNAILAILATTRKIRLTLRHIKKPDDFEIPLEMFGEFLKMEKFPNTDNIFIHRKSPYHILHGVMIFFHTEGRVLTERMTFTVYSRTSDQVLALIHHIQDAVPFRIVITTQDCNITSKSAEFAYYNENLFSMYERPLDYTTYASSMLNRTQLVLKYLDNSLIKMSESTDPAVLSKIGSEIDLLANGTDAYQDFKKKMWREASVGIEELESASFNISDEMIVD